MTQDPIGVVLAGGGSRRMGRDKARAQLGGRPLIEWVSAAMEDAGLDVVVAGPHRPGVALPCVADAPGVGPVAGLVGAMDAFPDRDLFVAAVDQPLLRSETVAALLRVPGDLVAPLADATAQVTCAVYRPGSFRAARAVLASGDPSLQGVARACRTVFIAEAAWRAWGEDGRSWSGIDTEEALAEAQVRLDAEGLRSTS